MSQDDLVEPKPSDKSSESRKLKRRNMILGLVIAACALFMYASIFVRLSINPLG